jgi:peptidoglycan/LPS O-acetylase OafA/YrhL
MDRTKSRFVMLDGLRGLAALVVVVWHTGATRFIPGGYLAVDLFFVLSGFVLSHAHGLRRSDWRSFILARAVRLYPLYAAGLALGTLVALQHLWSDGRFWATLGANSLVLPTPARWSTYLPFPLDTPAWSLFFEMLINAVWFAVLPVLSNRALFAVLVVSAVGVVDIIALKGSIDVGDSGLDFLPLGIVRASYSFFAGVGCYRVWKSGGNPQTHSWTPPLALIIVIAAPFPRALVDAVAVLAIFPALIFVGASTRVPSRISNAMTAVGAASYAIYTLHAPIIAWAGDVILLRAPQLRHPAYWIAAVVVPGMLMLGWMADRYFDAPLRSALMRWIRSPRTASSAAL